MHNFLIPILIGILMGIILTLVLVVVVACDAPNIRTINQDSKLSSSQSATKTSNKGGGH